MPQTIRPIPRAVPADAVAAFDAPSADPPEPFFWTEPSDPTPRKLRPIPALIRDTFGFVARNWRSTLVAALPAVVAVAISSLVYRWAYGPLFDDAVDGDFALRLSLASLAASTVGVVGVYVFTTALANHVVQSESDSAVGPGTVLRLAARRLPRVITVNLLYGFLVAAVIGLPLTLLLIRFLFERDLQALTPWVYLAAGIVAYAAPQINVFFTAIKIEERRPRFREARQLVRGQRAAVLGRVLLLQIVRVASTAVWVVVALRIGSLGWFCFSVVTVVVVDTILTVAFTLLYADLAGVSADDPAPENGSIAVENPMARDETAIPPRT